MQSSSAPQATFSLVLMLLTMLIPVLSAYITKWLMNKLKAVSATVDNLGTTLKQFIVFVISALLTLAFNLLGVPLTGEPTLAGLNSADVQALISAALAIVLHNSEKIKLMRAGPRNFSASGYRGKTDTPPKDTPSKDY